MSTDLATLIIQGLNGEHLHGFLPGNDNKGAISHAVSSKRGWSGPRMGWGQVIPTGVGEWPYATGGRSRKQQDASLFATWTEVLAVIERGCADGYRERYEAAYAAWGAAVNEAWKDYKPGQSKPVPWVDPGAINETKAALIRHGCEPPAVPVPGVPGPGEIGVQGELWDGAALPVAANLGAA
jgi:hypothetical protein